LFYPFFFVEANSLIPKSKLFKCDIFGEGSDVTNSLQLAKKNTWRTLFEGVCDDCHLRGSVVFFSTAAFIDCVLRRLLA
jgi:hypothetical protein